jgi:hypothetical protein
MGKIGLLCELLEQAAGNRAPAVELPPSMLAEVDAGLYRDAFYEGVGAGWIQGLMFVKRIIEQHFADSEEGTQ